MMMTPLGVTIGELAASWLDLLWVSNDHFTDPSAVLIAKSLPVPVSLLDWK